VPGLHRTGLVRQYKVTRIR